MATTSYFIPPQAQYDVIYDGSGSVTDFLQRFSVLAISYGWSEDDRIKYIGHHLQGSAKNWYELYRKSEAKRQSKSYDEVVLKWADLIDKLEKAFSSKETSEALISKAKAVKYEQCGSAVEYYYTLLPLLYKIDINMDSLKVVKYLIKGLPSSMKREVFMKNCKTPQELKEVLLQYEKFETLFKEDSKDLADMQSKFSSMNFNQNADSLRTGSANATRFREGSPFNQSSAARFRSGSPGTGSNADRFRSGSPSGSNADRFRSGSPFPNSSRKSRQFNRQYEEFTGTIQKKNKK
jgi:hypothetical protein